MSKTEIKRETAIQNEHKTKHSNSNYYNEFGEITLTGGKNFKKFPRTPRPTILLDGIFIRKKDIEKVRKINKRNEKWNRDF